MDGVQSPESAQSPDTTVRFNVNIPPETISALRQAGKSERSQAILDTIFTPKRREEMLKTASRDREGRPVRYFRKMSYDKLLNLLETGEQTHLSYIEDTHAPVDEDRLRFFLSRFSSENKLDYETSSKTPITEALRNTVGRVIPSEELEKAVANLNYGNLVPLLDKYLPDSFMKNVHTRSFAQMFSPYLSMSAGGIISMSSRPYVELILPDNQVTPHPQGVTGEKEVLTRRITTGNIARIFTSDDVLSEAEVTNAETAIGKYYEKTHDRTRAIEDWRWDEETDNFLPVSLLPSKS